MFSKNLPKEEILYYLEDPAGELKKTVFEEDIKCSRYYGFLKRTLTLNGKRVFHPGPETSYVLNGNMFKFDSKGIFCGFDIETHNRIPKLDLQQALKEQTLDIVSIAFVSDTEEIFLANKEYISTGLEREEFYKKIVEIFKRNYIFIGYNSLDFDLQVLQQAQLPVPVYHLDLFKFFSNPAIGQHTFQLAELNLEYVAERFGLKKLEQNLLDYETIQDYNVNDARITLEIFKKCIPLISSMMEVLNISLDSLFHRGGTYWASHFIKTQIFSKGILHSEEEWRLKFPAPEFSGYQGAIVLDPKPGVYKNVVVLDYVAMYVNIIIKYRLCPTRISICEHPECIVEDTYVCRYREGFLWKIVAEIFQKRQLSTGEIRKAYKVLGNLIYGALASPFFSFYNKDGAALITSLGRKNLLELKKLVEKQGLEVLYGDTDSVFIPNVEDLKVLDLVLSQTFLPVAINKKFKKFFLSSKKKTYLGITESGEIQCTGALLIKSSSPEFFREILKEVKTQDFLVVAKKWWNLLRSKKISKELLAIKVKMTKAPEAYAVDTEIVKLYRKGLDFQPGIKIKYYKALGGPALLDSSEPVNWKKYEEPFLAAIHQFFPDFFDPGQTSLLKFL